MPRSGATYSLPTSSDYPAVAGTVIDPDDHNATLEDLATAMTGSLARSGAGGMQAALLMNNYKITQVAEGVADDDAANVGQVQGISANGTAFALLSFTANTYMYATGAATFAIGTITADGRSLIGAANYAAMRALLDLEIGTDVQAYNANLTTWAGKTAPSGVVVGDTDTQTLSGKTLATPTINGGSSSAALQLSSETTGTLTTASANKLLALTGGITVPSAVFAARDTMIVDPGTSNRTVTRGSGMTMYVNGTDSASATVSANTLASIYYRSASVAIVSGSGVS